MAVNNEMWIVFNLVNWDQTIKNSNVYSISWDQTIGIEIQILVDIVQHVQCLFNFCRYGMLMNRVWIKINKDPSHFDYRIWLFLKTKTNKKLNLNSVKKYILDCQNLTIVQNWKCIW